MRLTDNIMLWTEWLNDSLVTVTTEPLNNYLQVCEDEGERDREREIK